MSSLLAQLTLHPSHVSQVCGIRVLSEVFVPHDDELGMAFILCNTLSYPSCIYVLPYVATLQDAAEELGAGAQTGGTCPKLKQLTVT